VAEGRTDRYLALRNASEGKTSATPRKTIDYAAFDLEKLAVRLNALPAGTSLRQEQFKGKIVRVEGRVAAGSRLALEFRGETWDVWSYDEALRAKLRADHAEGATLRCYAEIGQYRERWQLVIQDASWVK
jgi:hypothetical protein